MKRNSFLISAIILMLGGIFAKVIGALYKIPLTNILGSSGMGLYYLVFPVYSLILTFCSSGVSIALSTEVAKCRKIRQRYNEQKLLRVALLFSFAISSFFAIIIILFSKYLAEIQGNINAGISYIAIAPAIIVSSIIATLRGYFQGVENMVPTTLSLIIEQCVKLVIGLLLAHKLCNFGVEYAVLGAIIGVTISEIVALIIICLNFFNYKGQLFYNYKNKFYKSKNKYYFYKTLKTTNVYSVKIIKKCYYKCNSITYRYSTLTALKKLLAIVIPTTFTSLIIPLASMLDSFFVINYLVDGGLSSLVSTSLYGLWGGVVQSLISLPIVILSAISTSILPSLSGSVVSENNNEVSRRVVFYIKITWVFSLLMTILIAIFAKYIITFLYGGGLDDFVIDELQVSTTMLRLSSISIIYSAFLQMFSTILQTIGKSSIPFAFLTIGLIVRMILLKILVCLPNINIIGLIVTNTIFLGIVVCFLAWYVKTKIDIKIMLVSLIMPLLYSIISGSVMIIINWLLYRYINYMFVMIISSIIGCGLYIILVYFSKVFSNNEKCYLQFRKKKLLKAKNETFDV